MQRDGGPGAAGVLAEPCPRVPAAAALWRAVAQLPSP